MTTIRGEKLLWLQVMQEAVNDLHRRPRKGTRPNRELLTTWDRASALRFFFSATDSTLPVACEVLGLEIASVRRGVQRILGGAA